MQAFHRLLYVYGDVVSTAMLFALLYMEMLFALLYMEMLFPLCVSR